MTVLPECIITYIVHPAFFPSTKEAPDGGYSDGTYSVAGDQTDGTDTENTASPVPSAE